MEHKDISWSSLVPVFVVNAFKEILPQRHEGAEERKDIFFMLLVPPCLCDEHL
jgi:hypothetical protein